jgi:hypothetical protein
VTPTPFSTYRSYRTSGRRAPFAGRATGRRRAGRLAFVPLFVALLVAGGLVAAALPLTGVHIPGARRVQAFVDALPLPWKAPRPEFVPLPEAAAPPQAPAQAQPTAAPATPAPQPTAPAPTAQPALAPAPRTDQAPAARLNPAPASVRLQNFRHQWQTWNNCGPATITMATSHFGRPELQAQAATFLKPNADDKNVSPGELVEFVRSVGLRADYRVGGDLDRLKLLLANDIPVVVETWFTPHPNDGMGHYRLLIGYDDSPGRFVGYDSYEPPGANILFPYGAFDADWRVFNRTYIPVYNAELAPAVAAILGDDADDGAMWERALGIARQEVATNGGDAFGWYNVGASLVALGRTGEAVEAFDRARALRLPWRMLWYQFQPFEAYLEEGRLNDVLTLAGANLQQANDLEESHYYRGRALQAQGQTGAARSAYQAALRANPRYAPANYALSVLG